MKEVNDRNVNKASPKVFCDTEVCDYSPMEHILL